MTTMGIDIGSTTVKIALLDDDNRIVFTRYLRHHGRPMACLRESLAAPELSAAPDEMPVACTGSGKQAAEALLGLPRVNEIVAQAVAAQHIRPGVRTVIEIGGQDSKFMRLDGDLSARFPVIVDQRMNDVCAAGTGGFIDQQAETMGVSIEDFCRLALQARHPATVAGRCTVFAKTDVTHLRQEGVDLADIAAGICRAVVRNYLAQFAKGRELEKPILFQGGLAANPGVVRAFREALAVSEDDLVVPERFAVTGAIGAALLARDGRTRFRIQILLDKLDSRLRNQEPRAELASSLPPLRHPAARVASLPVGAAADGAGVFLGVDVGSTSTCAAVLDAAGRLLAKSYVWNKGDVLASVRRARTDIRERLGPVSARLAVRAVGVTGSGRHLVARYIGADVVRDEITAQAAAVRVMAPDADTVFEIGGQDSKYIRLRDGRVADFEMNKACSAGTGSFLQEQADRLKVPIHDMSRLAMSATTPANLGSRCTVFMESDVVHHQQRGAGHADLAAGLAYSVARNYLEKVVGGKSVGDRIAFLGGVAFNDSVVAACRAITGKEIVVPEHHEVSAAIGMAILARDESLAHPERTSAFLGFDPPAEDYAISTFQCKDCPNACRVHTVRARGEAFHHGGACGKYDRRQPAGDAPDFFKERESLLWNRWQRPPGGGDKIGIPRALMFYEFFPLWCVFLQELGFEVEVSGPTAASIADSGLNRSLIENCFAAKLAFGHVMDLQNRGITRIFFPSVVEPERHVPDIAHNYSCPQVQALPALVRAVLDRHVDLITPVFGRVDGKHDWRRELEIVGIRLGKPPDRIRSAIGKAAESYAEFRRRREEIGRRVLARLDQFRDPVIVVLGKPYNVADPGLNLQLARKLANAGAVPLPFDCLPLSERALPPNYADLVWGAGQDAVRAAAICLENPRLEPLVITGFGCGPDSFIAKYIEELFRNRSFLTLEMDEHTSDVGVTTRIEAFLNNRRPAGREDFRARSSVFRAYTPSPVVRRPEGTVFIPQATGFFHVLGAAFSAAGVRTKFLPPHDEETLRMGKAHSSGRECLPYLMYLGDAVRMTRDPDFHPDSSAFCIPGSNLSCRISAYPTAMRLALARLGFPNVEVIAPRTSMDKDEALPVLGMRVATSIFRGVLAVELLNRKRLETRPYEKSKGAADAAYERAIDAICATLSRSKDFWRAMADSFRAFDAVETDRSVPRPLVGLIGDEYTRGNAFANNGFVSQVEALGAEVWDGPILSNYLEFQRVFKPRLMKSRGRWLEYLMDLGKSVFERSERKRMNRIVEGRLRYYPDPDFSEMISSVAGLLDEGTEPLTMVGLAQALHLVKRGVDGLASLGAFQCMIEGVIAGCLKANRERLGNLPLLCLSFDFQQRTHQGNRLEAFMHQVKQRHAEHVRKDGLSGIASRC